MTRILAAVRGAMDKLFPWPGRAERKAAIALARGNREAAEARAAHAARVQEQIRQIAEQNHFAEIIARQIITRHGGQA